MKKIIYLSIANIRFKIIFNSVKNYFDNNIFNRIINKYKNYIIEKSLKKNNSTIFIENKEIDTVSFLEDNQNKSIFNFTNFYERTGRNSYITYSHISISQFNHLIFTVFNKLLADNQGFIIKCNGIMVSNKVYILLDSNSFFSIKLISDYLKNKIIIEDEAIIKEVNNKFYVYQSPFVSSKSLSRRYRLSRLVICTRSKKESSFSEISRKNPYINKVINNSTISKFLSKNSEFDQVKNKSIHTLLSFIDKTNLWHFNLGNKEVLEVKSKKNLIDLLIHE